MTDTISAQASLSGAGIEREPGTSRMLVIWNPDAGGGDETDVEDRRASLRAALADHGIDGEIFDSDSEASTDARVAAAVSDGVEVIVAAGGDGTVRSIATRLLGTEIALGILPLGTAMNVARSLGIPLDMGGAARVLAAGASRTMDVGEARGRPFLEIASIGVGAEVLAGATHAAEGRLRSAFDVLRRAVQQRRTRVRLQLDGRAVRGRALSIAIANGRYTGRGIELAPQARLDDGRFDVLLFEGFGPFGLLAHLARTLLGRATDPRIRRYRAATVRISTHRPLPVRVDSIDLGTTPVELVSRPGALRVIAPQDDDARR